MIGRRIRNSVRSFHLGLLGWHVGQDFPQLRHGGGPAPRAGKLYLPPGGTYFGSRAAYGLTYTSCQESRKFDGLYRRLAAHMGIDAALVRDALEQR